MKKILLLGASGSIGKQTIDVINNHSDKLCLVGASVGINIKFLKELLNKYKLEYVYSINRDEELEKAYPNVKFYYGENGIKEIVKETSYDMLVNALVGYVGFEPTLNAINNKKDVALANKETLIVGGDIINKALKDNDVKLYPIDSEHSAIFQCLQANDKKDVHKLIITASGGSFRDLNRDQLKSVTVEDALKHPNWNMGKKITIDSATMMNKGFEIIEAHYLFNFDFDHIDAVIQKESVIHSMVEYNDGSIIAQLGLPDMRVPIKYSLLYPNHVLSNTSEYLDFNKITSLSFKPIDYERYPLVKLAYEVGRKGGNLGAVLVGANDKSVALFLDRKISFLDIEKNVISAIKEAKYIEHPTLQDLIESYKWANNFVK